MDTLVCTARAAQSDTPETPAHHLLPQHSVAVLAEISTSLPRLMYIPCVGLKNCARADQRQAHIPFHCAYFSMRIYTMFHGRCVGLAVRCSRPSHDRVRTVSTFSDFSVSLYPTIPFVNELGSFSDSHDGWRLAGGFVSCEPQKPTKGFDPSTLDSFMSSQ